MALAEDVVASLPLPVFDNSRMDGYAVRAADVAVPGPTPAAAGRRGHSGRTHRPAHAEAGHRTPDHDRRAGAGRRGRDRPRRTHRRGYHGCRALPPPANQGGNIRLAGRTSPPARWCWVVGHTSHLAALGLALHWEPVSWTVQPRQRVLVVSTGAELVAPGAALRPGQQIYESNAVMLAAAVREAGGAVAGGDVHDVEQFRAVLAANASAADG